jgi:peptide/nickel transport system substrate-binding protein
MPPTLIALLTAWLLGVLPLVAAARFVAAQPAAVEEFLVTTGEVGRRGGQLTITQRAEPRTLNPVTGTVDSSSRDIVKQTIGDLIHINRETHRTEPSLARSWTVSPDGRRFTLMLRRGIRFSDGDPFDADDVIFSFQVYQDEKVASPQRESLRVGGKPIAVRKIDQYSVQLELAEPHAAADRLLDSLAMLPKHLLEQPYREGRLSEVWAPTAQSSEMAGLGPFRFKEYISGQRVVLERNPHYWKVDRQRNRLPYLDQLIFLIAANEDAQIMRFRAGDADVIARVGPENFAALEREARSGAFLMRDLGPGLEYNFLFFNLNNPGPRTQQAAVARKQRWFRQTAFRKAVSSAIDREAIRRLVYRGRATPLAGHVSHGNRLWVNMDLPKPARSLSRARDLMRQAGFRTTDGVLVDATGQTVEFSILVSAANAVLREIATIVQDDLKQIGIRVHVVPFDFRSMLDRILNTHDYEAAILTLGGGDIDPIGELNVWMSSGPQHLWHLGQAKPASSWEAEIDQLLRDQVSMLDSRARKRAYDRVQQIVADELPFIFLVSPNVLVGARAGLGNFRPVILEHQVLWNVEELFWRPRVQRPAR